MGIYNIHAGHCPQGQGASGAVGILKESVEDRLVKDEVVRLLKEKGHTAYDCTVDFKTTALGCLQNIVKMCNAHKVDLDISIHLNSGRNDLVGDGVTAGTEVYLFPGASTEMVKIATQICANISSDLGIKNRGVKYRNNLYVLRHTKAPAMLIECCFVDDKDDADRWDYKKCAKAIVDGILNEKTIEAQTNNSTLIVDGIWGKSTTVKTQKMLKRFFNGLFVDGIVSRQPISNKKYLPAVSKSSWEFTNKYNGGSAMISRLQWFIGADQDGFFGKESIKTLQSFLKNNNYYHEEIDGYMGKNTVKAWQNFLNDNVKE